MNDLPRQKLQELISQYGRSLCDDPRRCEAMLKDLCRNEHKREITVLISALRENMPAELIKQAATVPIEVIAPKLAGQLYEHLGIAEEFANWAVESWALALGLITAPLMTSKTPSYLISEKKQSPNFIQLSSQNENLSSSSILKSSLKTVVTHQKTSLKDETIKSNSQDQVHIEEFSFEYTIVKEKGLLQQGGIKKHQGKANKLIFTIDQVIFEMLLIPKGALWMGQTVGDDWLLQKSSKFYKHRAPNGFNRSDNERPRHHVTLRPFYLGKFPITQAQWEVIMGENPSSFKKNDHPVERVSWLDAQEFCKKLNIRTQFIKNTEIQSLQFRLPSEAEWEYACRAGTQTIYYFGENPSDLDNYAWYAANSDKQHHSVGKLQPNAFGLYDMLGNIEEWCADTYHENYKGAPTDGSICGSLDDKYNKVLRGGSWRETRPAHLRCAVRDWNKIDLRVDSVGFRIAASAAL